MRKNDHALKTVLAAVEQLSIKQKKQLTQRLIETVTCEENTAVVWLRRLPSDKQMRLMELMDKNNEGALNQAEQAELEQLGSEVDQMLLDNSSVLARTLRPELFKGRGEIGRAVLKNGNIQA